MLKLAITGGLASGKSLVGAFLRELGAAVCEADELAHALSVPGTPVFGEILTAFGAGILDVHGCIDRRELGRRVFGCHDRLAVLNSIVHPRVKGAWGEWLRQEEGRGSGMGAVIIPLLYEIGEAGGWDATVCVYSPSALQVSRLRERGLDAQEIDARLAAQMPVERKAALADYVIVNGGSRALLRRQTMRVLSTLWERAAGPGEGYDDVQTRQR